MRALSPNHHTMQSKANRIHVDIFDIDSYVGRHDIPVHRTITPRYVPSGNIIDLSGEKIRVPESKPFFYSILRA